MLQNELSTLNTYQRIFYKMCYAFGYYESDSGIPLLTFINPHRMQYFPFHGLYKDKRLTKLTKRKRL